MERFRELRVGQVVTLGDTCDAFGRGNGAVEVAGLLEGCGTIGVWGNHDVSLCRDVTPRMRAKYPEPVLAFMSRMQPRIELEECLFAHREATVDPHDVSQLWGLEQEEPDLATVARLGLAATSQRLHFVGHYHRWWAAAESGPLAWDGSAPLQFDPAKRYFVVVAPLFAGWCGVLDTDDGVLHPVRCGRDEGEAAASAEGINQGESACDASATPSR